MLLNVILMVRNLNSTHFSIRKFQISLWIRRKIIFTLAVVSKKKQKESLIGKGPFPTDLTVTENESGMCFGIDNYDECETNEVPLLFHLALVSKLTSLGRGRFFKILIIQKPREYQKPLVLKIH